MNKAIFLSIGENHLPQAILDRHNLNSIKTPFSNVRSNIDYVTQIFDEDFADLLNKKHLRYSERYGKRILINTKYNCNNSLYHPSVSNYFEFTDSNLIENKDDLEEYNKRISNFNCIIKSDRDLVFLYFHRYKDNSNCAVEEKLDQFYNKIKFKRNSKAKTFLFIIEQKIVSDLSERDLEYQENGNIAKFTFCVLNYWEGNNPALLWAYRDDDLILKMFAKIRQKIAGYDLLGLTILSTRLHSFNVVNLSDTRKILNIQYKALSQRDQEISKITTSLTKESIEEKEKLPNRLKIEINGTKYNLLFFDNTSSNRLFIIFSGARSINESPILFKRWSYFPYIDQKLLLISDPGLEANSRNEILLNWYLGDKAHNYYAEIAQIVHIFANKFKISNKNITFFGSSGGGFAALQMANFFKNTNHFTINPQIYIEKFKYFKYLHKKRKDIEDVVQRYVENIDALIRENENYFYISQNINDEQDWNSQIVPLLRKLEINRIEIGLNQHKNLLLWLYDCEGGHNAQGDQLLFSCMLNWAYKYFCDLLSEDDVLMGKSVALMFKNIQYLNTLSKKTS